MLLVVMEVGTRNFDFYLVPVTGVREVSTSLSHPNTYMLRRKNLGELMKLRSPSCMLVSVYSNLSSLPIIIHLFHLSTA